VSTLKPSASNFETLLKVSMKASRSKERERAWRTRTSRKGDF